MQTDVCAALSIWVFCAYAHTDTLCVGKLHIAFPVPGKGKIPSKRGETLGPLQWELPMLLVFIYDVQRK